MCAFNGAPVPLQTCSSEAYSMYCGIITAYLYLLPSLYLSLTVLFIALVLSPSSAVPSYNFLFCPITFFSFLTSRNTVCAADVCVLSNSRVHGARTPTYLRNMTALSYSGVLVIEVNPQPPPTVKCKWFVMKLQRGWTLTMLRVDTKQRRVHVRVWTGTQHTKKGKMDLDSLSVCLPVLAAVAWAGVV